MRKEMGSFKAYLSPMGAWALSFGCAIGWGAFLVPGSSFLPNSGVLGSIIGLVLGVGIMLVIARNYHTMIVQHPKAGGAFTVTRHMLNFDHGFLCAWFLCLTYLGLIWANCSAVALLVRYTMGHVFQGHYLYSVAGFAIYLEEVLICIAVLLLAGAICLGPQKKAERLQIFFVLVLIVGVTVSFLYILSVHSDKRPIGPMFHPDSPPWIQVIRAVTIMPWAFVGFESVSHSAEEFTFTPRWSFRIMALSVLMSALVYLVLLLSSVLMLPPQYPNWLAYIKDLGNLEGIAAIPTFSAVHLALGKRGIVLLGFTMLGGLFSSLVGNIICLSRLVTIMSEKEIFPFWLGKRTSENVPNNAILAILCITLIIPFLGRTAIGWNVDVSNIGATIVYGYTSIDAYRYSRVTGDNKTRVFGLLGMVFAGIFLFLQMIPNYALSKESFLILTVWTILGFLMDYYIVRNDLSCSYGRSPVVWVALMALTIYTSSSFVWQSSLSRYQDVARNIILYYKNGEAAKAAEFVERQMRSFHISNIVNYVISLLLILIAFVVLLGAYSVINRRERENERMLGEVRVKAFTDKLTGCQSINAYRDKELEINSRIKVRRMTPFALVICDVNDLKKVNDLLGHQAGDRHLLAASALLQNIFIHSGLYRVGGDEFVVLLEGEDYRNRKKLLENLDRANKNHLETGKVRVAFGMSEWQENDEFMASVFARADICMYKKKSEMKRTS